MGGEGRARRDARQAASGYALRALPRIERLATFLGALPRGCEHVVLERARIAERWRTQRWDSLRFQFPNWGIELPGHPPYAGGPPDAFAHRSEIWGFLETDATAIRALLRCGVDVTTLRLDDRHGYELTTPQAPCARAMGWWRRGRNSAPAFHRCTVDYPPHRHRAGPRRGPPQPGLAARRVRRCDWFGRVGMLGLLDETAEYRQCRRASCRAGWQRPQTLLPVMYLKTVF
jgi:hypothetical protein